MRHIFIATTTSFLIISQAFQTRNDPGPCIPKIAHSDKVDDVPAIQKALEDCGNGGTVLIPQENSYNLLSPLNFSSCYDCKFQIEGSLQIWHNKSAALDFSKVKGARLHSLTGTGRINGNSGAGANNKGASVVHITGRSCSITFSNLTFINPTGTIFEVDNFSSNLTFSSLRLGWAVPIPSNQVPVRLDGFSITNSSEINITDVRIHHTYSCINLQNGVSDLVVSNIDCKSTFGGVWFDIELQTVDFNQTASNILFQNLTISGSSTATGIRAGNKGSFTATNITWDGVHLNDVMDWVKIVSCIGGPKECGNPGYFGTTIFLDAAFLNFDGTAWYDSGNEWPRCNNDASTHHVCKIRTENINVRSSHLANLVQHRGKPGRDAN